MPIGDGRTMSRRGARARRPGAVAIAGHPPRSPSMRILAAAALAVPAAAVLAFAAISARADGEPAPAPAPAPAAAPAEASPRVVALEAQVAALRADVEYLK